MFEKTKGAKVALLIVYVDDIVITRNENGKLMR